MILIFSPITPLRGSAQLAALRDVAPYCSAYYKTYGRPLVGVTEFTLRRAAGIRALRYIFYHAVLKLPTGA